MPMPARRYVTALLFAVALVVSLAHANAPAPAANPAIDMEGYLKVSREAAKHRATRRVSEEDFMRMAREPNTIVLDARSREKYDERHIQGAVSLAFSDIAVESLARAIPDKNTRILIYCNNNFENNVAPVMLKRVELALNIQTFINLYGYGYRNVYELGEVVNFNDPKVRWVRGG